MKFLTHFVPDIRRAAARLVLSIGLVIAPVVLSAQDAPEPLAEKQTIKVAYGKFGFVSPLAGIQSYLDQMNIAYEGVEFQRYADTRTAISSKEVDIGLTGGALLVSALDSGNTSLVALSGVAGETIYPVVRNGVEVNDWQELVGLKIGAGVGGNVWLQWAAKLIE